MCYNTEYVGYEQKRIKQEHILFMGGGYHCQKVAGWLCAPDAKRQKKICLKGRNTHGESTEC